MFSNKKIIVIIFIVIAIILAMLITFFTYKYHQSEDSDINHEDVYEKVDNISPIIILDDVYAVKTGYNKNLIDVIMSADDTDPNPIREIIGEYDLNTEGEYQLTYKIQDSSGNIATKDFTLRVRNNYTYKENDIKYEDAISRYKTENTKLGIDVSKWQEEIDWEKVKQSGVEFAVIRMCYQNGFDGELLVDPYFEQNAKGCLENNIPFSVYFSSYAKTSSEAKEQANWVNQTLNNYNYKNTQVSFDWENWNSFNKLNLSLNDINEIADTFMNEIENSGNKSMLYGSKTYLEKVWKNEKNYPVWLANYVTETTYEKPYKMWQFCQTGVIDGISGHIDINVMYE